MTARALAGVEGVRAADGRDGTVLVVATAGARTSRDIVGGTFRRRGLVASVPGPG
ncbi:hypothetical protein PV779_52745 [Streptomyces sp. ID01-9D]|nr:hypothetical protein [Streptomyces sp. ID01-9D]